MRVSNCRPSSRRSVIALIKEILKGGNTQLCYEGD
jgi:hypothetical protein